jgi:hypothetical protein
LSVSLEGEGQRNRQFFSLFFGCFSMGYVGLLVQSAIAD